MNRPAPWWFSLALIVAGVLMLAFGSCSNPYEPAWKGLATAHQLVQSADTTLAKVCRQRFESCRGQRLGSKAAKVKCLGACYSALRTWQSKILPSLNTAMVGAVAALEAAQSSRKDPPMEVVARVGCLLVRALEQWAPALPALGRIAGSAKAICALGG